MDVITIHKRGESMIVKLFDSEYKVMEILWNKGDTLANDIAKILKEQIGWNINTTYSVINKLEKKGAIEKRKISTRKTICHSLLNKEDVQADELDGFVKKIFDGSSLGLANALVERDDLPKDVAAGLKALLSGRR